MGLAGGYPQGHVGGDRRVAPGVNADALTGDNVDEFRPVVRVGVCAAGTRKMACEKVIPATQFLSGANDTFDTAAHGAGISTPASFQAPAICLSLC